MNKYSSRGFTLVTGSFKGEHSDLRMGKRATTDEESWIFRFAGMLSSIYMLIGIDHNVDGPTCPHGGHNYDDVDVAFEVIKKRNHGGAFIVLDGSPNGH